MGGIFSKKKGKTEERVQSAPAVVQNWSGGSSPTEAQQPQRPASVQSVASTDKTTPRSFAPAPLDAAALSQTSSHLSAKAAKGGATKAEEKPEPAGEHEWCEIFGEENVVMVQSSTWSERERGLKNLHSLLLADTWDNQEASKVWKACCGLLQKCVRDKVAPVYFSSLEVLKILVRNAACSGVSKEAVRDQMNDIAPALVHRAGNLNSRISQASIETLVLLAGEKPMGMQYISPFVMEPVKRTKNQTTVMSGRLEMLMSLLDRYGLSDKGGGLSARQLLYFTRSALEMPDDKVRNLAVQLIVAVYMANGRQLEMKHFGTLKPALLKMLERKFAEVDAAELGEEGGPGMGCDDADLPPLVGTGASSLPPLDTAFPPMGNVLTASPSKMSRSGSNQKKRVLEERSLNKSRSPPGGKGGPKRINAGRGDIGLDGPGSLMGDIHPVQFTKASMSGNSLSGNFSRDEEAYMMSVLDDL